MKQQVTEKQLIQIIQQEEKALAQKENYYSQLQEASRDSLKTIEGLKEIQKKPTKIMVNLGAGVLIEAQIQESVKCKRIFSEKGYIDDSIKSTLEWLEKRKAGVDGQLQKVGKDILETQQKLNDMITIIKQIEVEKRKNIASK